MSETGKVSLPTPEQIEEIKERLTERQARKGSLSTEEVELMELLAALEEAQQQLKDETVYALDMQQSAYRLKKELEEAKQQNARWKEAVNALMMGDTEEQQKVILQNMTIEILKKEFSQANEDRSNLADERHELIEEVDALKNKFYEAQQTIARQREARTIDEWHEDFGDVLWWTFPIEEPPYCGSPLDMDWPDYLTHWTPIVIPERKGATSYEPTADDIEKA